MLDFGSRMSSTPERDEDDLFADIPADHAAEKRAAAMPPAGNIPVEKDIPEPEEVKPEVHKPEVYKPEEVKPEKVKPEVHKPEKPRQESPDILFRRRKNSGDADAGKLETIRILKDVRQRAGLTLEDVEKETQIRVHFLSALEEGRFDDLPQQVYVLAYLRKLCGLYNIPKTDEEALVMPWRQVMREVPEMIPGSVIPDEDSVNSKVLRRLEVGFLAAGAILVIGLITFLVILGVSYLNQKKVSTHFDNKSLLELQEKPRLTAPGLPPVQRNR